MYRSHKLAGWSLFFLLAACGSIQAQEQSPQHPQTSCRNFVQGFYNWYLHQHVSWERAPKHYAFSQELRRLLKAAVGELDFDPFLATNGDPYQRYVTGKVTVKGDRFRVAVYGIGNGKRSNKPVLVPEVMLKDGRWVFVNFHYGKSEYPVNENLLSILKYYQRERRKNSE